MEYIMILWTVFIFCLISGIIILIRISKYDDFPLIVFMFPVVMILIGSGVYIYDYYFNPHITLCAELFDVPEYEFIKYKEYKYHTFGDGKVNCCKIEYIMKDLGFYERQEYCFGIEV